MKIHLLVIDPQMDFCSPVIPHEAVDGTMETDAQGRTSMRFVYRPGALLVPGADKDMERLAAMVERIGNKIDQIHVTMDSHGEQHIAHPVFWVNSKGEHPNPFTLITKDDVTNGVWTTTNPAIRQKATEYVSKLATNGRYVLCIWPPHCITGTPGWSVMPCLSKVINKWAYNRCKKIDFVTKGSNPFTEHYSAVMADVPDSSDPTTMLNTDLITYLSAADKILVAGEARSHCVASTLTDIANNFGEENIKKFVLLQDAMSDVPGFEKLGKDFLANITKRGAEVSDTKSFLA